MRHKSELYHKHQLELCDEIINILDLDKENSIILEMLTACHGKRKDVADKLGMSPRTLRYKLAKMREMGIEIPA